MFFMCVTWRIHVCVMTHSDVWHESFWCVTWRAHMCGDILTPDNTNVVPREACPSCVWHDAFMWVTWLFLVCDVTHTYVWRCVPCSMCTWHKNDEDSVCMSYVYGLYEFGYEFGYVSRAWVHYVVDWWLDYVVNWWIYSLIHYRVA